MPLSDPMTLIKEKPVFAVAIVGGLAYLWYAYGSKGEAEEPDTRGIDGGAFIDTGRVPGPGDGDDGDDTPGGPRGFIDNLAWESAAIDYLIGRGFSAAFAQQAVSKALQGEALTKSQMAAVSLCIAALGNPPEGMPPLVGGAPDPDPPTTPTPKPTTPAPARRGEYVTVARWKSPNPPWNSTLWGIANRYYKNGALWPRIWSAPENKGLHGRPSRIYAGDRVFVPL